MMNKNEGLAIKENLFIKCTEILNNKVEELKAEVTQLRTSIANDSKSSMGDKYETSREMMQQEINRLEQQISINSQQLFKLKSVQVHQDSETVMKGSLIETNLGNFLIAASFGELTLDNFSCFVISEAAPIAQFLLGNKVKYQFIINKKQVSILNIY